MLAAMAEVTQPRPVVCYVVKHARNSVERGEPITFGLNQVIKGWQEGLQYMVVGEKIRLFVPSTLGYGKNGTGPIPPASVLIFDVELLDIQ